MTNAIKDIVNRLDGYSTDNQSFAVISFEITENAQIKLKVQPYVKVEEAEALPEEEHLGEITNRLLSKFLDNTAHYTVLKAEKQNGWWELLVQEVPKKTGDTKNAL